jgi:ubiquinone/menaquinone biosynthesis C-methylase UbiE
MDFFERQWSSYRAVVEHDLMEHRAVATATEAALRHWLAQRSDQATPPALLDLGCGDLALLAPLLRELPLGRYSGLDLAAVVLPLAQRALGPVPYATDWLEGDLLAWAQAPKGGDPAVDQPDILHSAFAIHHLNDAQKHSFLQGARRRINANGVFLWVDVFREPDETREAYIARYCQRIRSGWQPLSPEQQEHVIEHLSQWDIPADRAAIQASAEQAGWRWHWAWQGQHHAEALAILTPN